MKYGDDYGKKDMKKSHKYSGFQGAGADPEATALKPASPSTTKAHEGRVKVEGYGKSGYGKSKSKSSSKHSY